MKTILLIEDAADLAAVIERELEANGYAVLYAGDGLQGLAMFHQRAPDLVILDWMLPGLDGLEVLRRLRANAPTPILMLTARDDEADRVLGLEVGADDYLTKPFSMRELLARVRALFRRTELIEQTLQRDRSVEGAPNELGRLTIDPQAYRVTLDGVP